MKKCENNDGRPWQGLMSGLALTLCLCVPAGAFGSGGPGTPRGGGEGGDAAFAGGDETVGTLPLTNGGNDDGGLLDPSNPWDGIMTLGGSLTIEGPATSIMTTITALRGQPRLEIQALPGGRQRWTIGGDFDLALDLGLLPGSGLTISVESRALAWSDVQLRGRDLGQVALSAQHGLDLPLVQLVQNGQVPSGLTVTTVDAFGTATQLSTLRTRQGLVLSQRNTVIH